ncbi:DUF1737 domain-containing protein [Massilia sp. METH4]|uniref:DUF1737 domain-containing protein n=1 Tax=Massilia sp. METH4 TaxID=3123041 RepID=UPI0030D59DC0
MQNIVEYVVLYDFPAGSLTKKVMKWIEAGYQPLGGVSAAYNGKVVEYQQAMVKYGKETVE